MVRDYREVNMANNNIGTAYIQILPSARGISAEIKKELKAEGLQDHIAKPISKSIGENMSGRLKGIGAGFTAVGKKMALTSIGAGVLGAKWVQSARTAQESQTKLTEVMHAMMGATGKQVDKVNELIDAEAKSGVVGKTVQRNGAQQLATYLHSNKALETLIPAMNDLAVQQYGTSASSEQLVGISNMMGKVFTGQVGALRRAGISFDKHSEKIMKTGTEQQKAAELAKVIGKNVGNMNQKMAETPSGQIQKAKMALAGIGTQMGSVLLPYVAKMAQWLADNLIPRIKQLADMFEAHPILAKIAVGIAGVLIVASPLMMLIGGIISSVGSLVGVVGGAIGVMVKLGTAMSLGTRLGLGMLSLQSVAARACTGIISAFSRLIPFIGGVFAKLGAVLMANPWLLAVAAAVVAAILIIKNWDKVKAAVAKVWNGIKGIAGPIWNGIKNTVGNAMDRMKRNVSNNLSAMKAAYTRHGGGIKGVVAALATYQVNRFKSMYNRLNALTGGRLGSMLSIMKSKFGAMKSSAGNSMSSMFGTISRGLSRVKHAFSRLILKIPKPHLPNISIDWKKAGKGKVSINYPVIRWNAAGGIFTKPTLLGGYNGVGEAGAEAVLPLSTLWDRFDRMADNIVNGVIIANRTAGAAAGPQTINITLYADKNGAKLGEWVVKAYDTYKRRLG